MTVRPSSQVEDPMVFVDYDPTWPDEFEAVAARLQAALGERALRIDHIGSTAVPGLIAKDIIDVQVTVESFDGIAEPVEAAGFEDLPWIRGDHRPPGTDVPDDELGKLFFELHQPRRVNLHVRLAGRFNQRYPLLCRDYLRAHPGAAAAYGAVKRALAEIVRGDVDAFYAVKNPVFDILMAGAEDWAANVDWSAVR
ncbi:MAG: GrpB family protein [Chloroflexota bacterium]